MADDTPEVTEAFVLKLLNTIAAGPVGAALQALAAGESRLLIKQNRDGEGWVLEVQKVPDAVYYGQQVMLCGDGQHSFNAAGQCIHCPAKQAPGVGMYIL